MSTKEEILWVLVDETWGNGVFYIAMYKGQRVIAYLDKYGIFNVFPDIENFIAYTKGGDCERTCVETDPNREYPEGEDALDVWIKENVGV